MWVVKDGNIFIQVMGRFEGRHDSYSQIPENLPCGNGIDPKGKIGPCYRDFSFNICNNLLTITVDQKWNELPYRIFKTLSPEIN